jgi:RNA polymerase sigma-70 factor (ECF subfamily)
MISEERIINECKRGNPKFQKLLFERFAPRMLGVCVRYFKTIEEAEDALQDGFIKVFNKIETYRGDGSFEGWIRRIMVNTSINLHRQNFKHYFHIEIDNAKVQVSDERVDFDALEVEDIVKKIKNLPNGYQLVFNLFEVEGYSHKEIGDMLNISENTSKSQLLKAKRKLRESVLNYTK